MTRKEKEAQAMNKHYRQLIGAEIVGLAIDGSDAGIRPFPILTLRIGGRLYDCAISADEEGNGGGFMFIEDHI